MITKFDSPKQYLQRIGKISVQQHEGVLPGTSVTVQTDAVGKVSTQRTWTDAVMNYEGNLIAVRSNSDIVFYPRNSTQTVADALGSTACGFVSQTQMLSNQKQFESVIFMPFPYFAEASECLNASPCTVSVTRYKLLF